MCQARLYRMRAVKFTEPVLLGAVWLRFPAACQRTTFTLRSYPAIAPPPPLTGVYVHVAPLSLEYSIVKVNPVVPGLAVADPSLKSVLVGTLSIRIKLSPLPDPLLVKAILKTKSVPGG